MQTYMALHGVSSSVLAWAVLLVLGSGAIRPAPLSAQQGVETITKFVAAFNTRDVDAIMAFFADDAVYHNMPMQPAKGKAAIRKVIESFVGPASRIDFEVLHIAQAGNAVLTERVDRFVMNGKEVALPVMGTFELANGKISAWRDYFDLATWQRQTTR